MNDKSDTGLLTVAGWTCEESRQRHERGVDHTLLRPRQRQLPGPLRVTVSSAGQILNQTDNRSVSRACTVTQYASVPGHAESVSMPTPLPFAVTDGSSPASGRRLREGWQATRRALPARAGWILWRTRNRGTLRRMLLDDIFWATLGLIFLTAILSAFVRLRQRDACLKLLDDHHVTLVMAAGRAVWGDLRVHPQGLELRYAAPYRSRAGLVKTGYLLYQPEMGALLAMCRYVGQLTPDERAERARQIAATFNPGFARRSLRKFWNIFNTLRDAFSRALSAFIGQLSKTTQSKALASQQKTVDATGQELLSAVGNAYEPMLEAHIGKPVIVELKVPGAPEDRVEIAGYLAEYTQHFIAVFNVDHSDGALLEACCDAQGQLEAPAGLALELRDGHLTVVNTGLPAVYVEGLVDPSGRWRRLGATLPRGCSLRVAPKDQAFTLRCRAVSGIDLVCPRQHATVRYASGGDALEAEDGLAPDHEDEQAAFP